MCSVPDSRSLEPVHRPLLWMFMALLWGMPLWAAEAPVDGEQVYIQNCAACHDTGVDRAPDRAALEQRSQQNILASLTSGTMQIQGSNLSESQRQAVARFLSPVSGDTFAGGGLCSEVPPFGDPFAQPIWNGWGPDTGNSHWQSAENARLDATQVPQLELKWAFAYPDATAANSQPTVASGRVFVGSQNGNIYALDAKTGCTYWTYQARSGVRTAISIGVAEEGRYDLYFGDFEANIYALDAETGELQWIFDVEQHPFARITGSPILVEGRLVVPVSSVEETAGSQPSYGCCTFRGSIVVLDAASGEQIWKTYTVQDEPQPRGTSSQGVTLYGPSGGAIWSAPTIDLKRGRIYASVGNTYSEPASENTDAVLAFDYATGEILWSRQTVPGDAYVIGCNARGGNPNCPESLGPDFDFGTSPILATTPEGKELIIVGQKSGMGYALDPDKNGAVVWEYRAGLGSPLGGILWGVAVDERHAYFPVADTFQPVPGGLHAVDLSNGQRVWHTPAPPVLCPELGRACSPAQSAAITVIPGVVFSGSQDGGMRAYNSETGEIIWTFNTNGEFDTVNGVPGAGASIVGAGPSVVDGMLYTNSGYGSLGARPGNLLMAFGLP